MYEINQYLAVYHQCICTKHPIHTREHWKVPNIIFGVWGSPKDYIRLKGRGSSQNHLGLKRGHC